MLEPQLFLSVTRNEMINLGLSTTMSRQAGTYIGDQRERQQSKQGQQTQDWQKKPFYSWVSVVKGMKMKDGNATTGVFNEFGWNTCKRFPTPTVHWYKLERHVY